ncbi:MAG TPA: S41 family peptidase [Chitinophagaceae bacterium]|nr:S41 family peptidase [Chitinophagaceae bacterium]
MRSVNYKLVLAFAMGLVVFSACKKNKGGDDVTPPPPGNSQSDIIKDSALFVAKELYLWYNQIPASFNARNYSDPNKIMEAIRAYSKEPGFQDPVDVWSFAYKQADWDNVSSGAAQDYGLNVFFRVEGDLRVRFVEKASPAGKAGIRRGWRITKVNGSSNITTGNSSFLSNAIYGGNPTVNLTFQKPDGSSVDITLNAAGYQENPVFLDTVYTVNAKKVGYLVFNSFLGDTNAIKNKFEQVFNRFATESVTEVIVDLRYNGGGYVSLQDWLANYLVKSSANGQTMMTQAFNDKYADWNSSTTFNKKGSLNPDNLYFIVSSNTASASELLINNLRPFMNVKLVGPSKTYGKPVGYFPFPVGDWYVFPVSFRSTNKNGQGNYFGGMALDNQVADGIDKDWGDITEASLASVIKYIGTGAFRMRAGEAYTPDPVVDRTNNIFASPDFKGMVDTRKLR